MIQGVTYQRLEQICGANRANDPLFRMIFLFSFFTSIKVT